MVFPHFASFPMQGGLRLDLGLAIVKLSKSTAWIRLHLDPGAEVVPEVLAGNDQPEDENFAAIMERFKYVEPEKKDISETL